jgi:glutamine cyclotransferase
VGPQRLFRGDRIVSKQWMRVAMLVVAGQFCAQATVPVHVSATGVYTDGREVAPPDGSSPPPSRFGEVVRSFPTPTGYATGIAWDGNALFVADGVAYGVIWRLDATDGTVLGSYDIGILKLRGLAMGGGFLWVASWDTESIYKLRPSDGRILDSFEAPFPGKPDGIAWDGLNLWVGEETESDAGSIHRIDPATGTILDSIVAPSGCCFNPRGLAWTPSGIWAGYQSIGRIYKVDPANGGSLGWISAPSGAYQQGVSYDGQYLWSTGGDNMVYQIDIGKPVSVETTPWGAIKARYRE